VGNYVGCGACICFDVEYDINATILFLMTMFEVSSPTIQTCAIKVTRSITRTSNFIEKDINIFGVVCIYGRIFTYACFLELSLLKRLSITPTTSLDPLGRWWIHEG
jgi:hypothetical protein